MIHRFALALAALAALALPARAQVAAAQPQPLGAEQLAKFPYSMIGQVLYRVGSDYYSGSATVVRPKSVITAAHNLWDEKGGWATDVEFRRGRHGATQVSRQFATRLYILGGYRDSVRSYGQDSLAAFHRDFGGIKFSSAAAGGAFAGWSTNTALLTGESYNIALGYGGEGQHTGDELLYVEPQNAFYKTYGTFFENSSIRIEHGMSGGPVFAQDKDGELTVAAVVVAGSDTPPAGGVRTLNASAAKFIRTYLP